MRLYRLGSSVRVVLSWRDVDAVARRWPCSGRGDEYTGIGFTFDVDGDLEEVDEVEYDVGFVGALCDDARAYAQRRGACVG